MNQNEYDELKELIYRLKKYVDQQDLKMSMYAWCQAKAERGRYYDPEELIYRLKLLVKYATFPQICRSAKEDKDKYTDSKLDEICHKINSKMIEMGIVHEKSGKMVFPFLDQVEYERRKSDPIRTMIKQKADDITRRVNEDSTMDLGPSMFPNLKQKGENDI